MIRVKIAKDPVKLFGVDDKRKEDIVVISDLSSIVPENSTVEIKQKKFQFRTKNL